MGHPSSRRSYVVAAVLGLLAAMLVAWVNLAVGIIGEPDNPANLMYAGVVVIGALGGLLARFRPAGMARAMAYFASAEDRSGVRAEADTRNEKINYKVREHSVGKVPVILAVGAREVEERTVTVRRLGEKQTSVESFETVTQSLSREATPPSASSQSR